MKDRQVAPQPLLPVVVAAPLRPPLLRELRPQRDRLEPAVHPQPRVDLEGAEALRRALLARQLREVARRPLVGNLVHQRLLAEVEPDVLLHLREGGAGGGRASEEWPRIALELRAEICAAASVHQLGLLAVAGLVVRRRHLAAGALAVADVEAVLDHDGHLALARLRPPRQLELLLAPPLLARLERLGAPSFSNALLRLARRARERAVRRRVVPAERAALRRRPRLARRGETGDAASPVRMPLPLDGRAPGGSNRSAEIMPAAGTRRARPPPPPAACRRSRRAGWSPTATRVARADCGREPAATARGLMARSAGRWPVAE